MKGLIITVAGLAITGAASAATYNNAAQYAGTIGHGLRTGATTRSGVAAPAGAFWSEVADGNTNAGFAHQSPFRVADDFTVGAGGWQINSIRFFGYQTGSSTTSTFTGLNLRIWNGTPGASGSSIVFGDTTTNRLTGSSFSGDYRTFSSTNVNGGTATAPVTTRPIMNLDVGNLNVVLGAGTYWFDWQASGTLGSGPWAPAITAGNARSLPGMNGLQFNTTWAAALDPGDPAALADVGQDFPFLIDYTPVPTPGAAAVFGLAGLAGLRRRR